MLGFNIFKVSGKSMKPVVNDDSFVFTVPFVYTKPDSLFVFNHKKYGYLIKRLKFVDRNGFFWFQGESIFSISSTKIGPIKKEEIIGKVLILISKR